MDPSVDRARPGRDAEPRPARSSGFRDRDQFQQHRLPGLPRPARPTTTGNRSTATSRISGRGGQGRAGRGVHDRPLARHPHPLCRRHLLQGRGRLRGRARRGDAHRIPGDRRRRVPAADRLPRSRLVPAQPVPASRRRPSSAASPTATSPRSTPRPRGLPADRMRLHICWGNYEGPHTHDIAARRHHRHRAEGAPAGPEHRGRQPAPRARMGGPRRRSASPTTRC